MKFFGILFAALLFVALVYGAAAGPVEIDENNNGPESGGSKTWQAIKDFFSPVTNYFRGMPEKTPSEVATDVKEKATEIKEWAKENEAIQALVGALTSVKDWAKEKASALEDKTFREMYEHTKERVSSLDDKIGAWIQERTKAEYQAEQL